MIAYGKMQISDLVAFLLYVSIFIRPILRRDRISRILIR